MLFSLIHTGTGSASQYRLLSFERDRLIQFLFGYHYLTSSFSKSNGAERSSPPAYLKMEIAPHPGGCFAKTARNDKKLNIQGLSRIEVNQAYFWASNRSRQRPRCSMTPSTDG